MKIIKEERSSGKGGSIVDSWGCTPPIFTDTPDTPYVTYHRKAPQTLFHITYIPNPLYHFYLPGEMHLMYSNKMSSNNGKVMELIKMTLNEKLNTKYSSHSPFFSIFRQECFWFFFFSFIFCRLPKNSNIWYLNCLIFLFLDAPFLNLEPWLTMWRTRHKAPLHLCNFVQFPSHNIQGKIYFDYLKQICIEFLEWVNYLTFLKQKFLTPERIKFYLMEWNFCSFWRNPISSIYLN